MNIFKVLLFIINDKQLDPKWYRSKNIFLLKKIGLSSIEPPSENQNLRAAVVKFHPQPPSEGTELAVI